MAEIASAYVSLLPSAKGFGSKLQSQIGGDVKKSGSHLGGVFGKTFIAATAAVGGAVAIGALLKDSIGEAREAQKVGALTTSTIKATGGAANVTATQVGNLAGALSLKTGIDDEVIQSGQNMLLTFKNIKNEAGAGNDIFNQTTKTLVDLSAAMGTEPKQAAIQLGKALNDPIKGVTALSRVGVTFTEGQKAQIKTLVDSGKTLDAQKIILKELNSEFGGAAAAQATAGEKASVAFGNIKEAIGTALLPAIDAAENAFLKLAPSIIAGVGRIGPIFSQVRAYVASFIADFRGGVGVAGQFASAFSVLGGVLMAVGGFILNNKAAVGTFVGVALTLVAAVKVWTIAQAALNFVLAANPIGLVILAIAGLAAGFVYAYQKSETFRTIVNGAFEFLKTAVTTVVSFVTAHWKLIVVAITGPLGIVALLVASHFNQIKSFVTNAVSTVVGFVRDHWRLIVGIIGGPIVAAVLLVTSNWGKIKSATSAAWNAVKSAVSSAIGGVKSAIGGLAGLVGKVRGWFGQMLSAIRSKLGEAVSFVKGFPGRVVGALGDMAHLLFTSGQRIIQGLIDGIKSRAGDVKGAVKGVLQGARNLLPFSPAKEGPFSGKGWTLHSGRSIVRALADGIKDGEPWVKAAMEKVLDALSKKVDAAKSHLDDLKSQFASVKDAVAQAFSGDLFSVQATTDENGNAIAGSIASAFSTGLNQAAGQVKALQAAFEKLKGFGLDKDFLSSLFQSGNSGLILELAAGGKSNALADQQLFQQVNSDAAALGNSVATNQFGQQINVARHQLHALRGLRKDVQQLDKKFADRINKALVDSKKGR